MSLTKANLIQALSEQSVLSKNDAKAAVEAVLGIIKQTLESGENVMISGFGKFAVKEKKQRRGRNPATGNALTLDARRVVTFKCSNILRERINGEY
jgi:integration host factor subunit alpha